MAMVVLVRGTKQSSKACFKKNSPLHISSKIVRFIYTVGLHFGNNLPSVRPTVAYLVQIVCCSAQFQLQLSCPSLAVVARANI